MRLQSAPNFRDLGGLPTEAGQVVVPGRLFRSEVLDGLSPDDLARLASTPVGAVCDLRTPQEQAEEIGLWPAPGSAPLITASAAYDGLDIVRRKHWSQRLLDDGYGAEQARRHMVRSYQKMPTSFAGVLGDLFAHLETVEGAVLIHCMAGKDRTGFVIAMLLCALGVTRDAIFEDYLLSGKHWPTSPKVIAVMEALFDGDPPDRAREAAGEVGGTRAEYLQAAFGQIEADFGSVDDYLGGLASAARRQRLRDRLLVPA